MNITYIIYYIIVAAFWGGSFIAIKPLVAEVSPFFAAGLRVVIAFLFLSMLLPVMKIPLSITGGIKKRVWLIGQFAFTLPFALLFWGEQLISPGLAGILNGTVPLYVFILGAIFTPGIETITKRKISGLVLGILGLLVIFYPQIQGGESNSYLGTIAVSLMAMSYAIAGLMNRNIFNNHPGIHPFTNLYQQLMASSIVMLPLSLAIDGFPAMEPFQKPSIIFAVLYLAIGSTSIAFILFYKLIKAWGVVRASTSTYLVPIAALIFDFFINKTQPAGSELLGVLIVTLAIVTLNWPTKTSLKSV